MRNLIPVCVTFGPLFMGIGSGTLGIGFVGSLMTMAGLAILFATVVKQGKVIEDLQASVSDSNESSASS